MSPRKWKNNTQSIISVWTVVMASWGLFLVSSFSFLLPSSFLLPEVATEVARVSSGPNAVHPTTFPSFCHILQRPHTHKHTREKTLTGTTSPCSCFQSWPFVPLPEHGQKTTNNVKRICVFEMKFCFENQGLKKSLELILELRGACDDIQHREFVRDFGFGERELNSQAVTNRRVLNLVFLIFLGRFGLFCCRGNGGWCGCCWLLCCKGSWSRSGG